MEQPTKEEVETWKYESAHSPLHDHAFENHNRLICIADAYLALREEVDEADRRAGAATRYLERIRETQAASDDWLRKAKEQWGVHENTSFDVVWEECLQLKADNQALQGSLVEQRRRMQDEYDGLLDRMAGYRKADADEIKRLKEENQELKAKIETHESGYGHLLATGQKEREEMRRNNKKLSAASKELEV